MKSLQNPLKLKIGKNYSVFPMPTKFSFKMTYGGISDGVHFFLYKLPCSEKILSWRGKKEKIKCLDNKIIHLSQKTYEVYGFNCQEYRKAKHLLISSKNWTED